MHYLRHSVAEWELRPGLIIDVVVLLKEPLKSFVTLNVILFESKDLEGLLFRNEAALDTQPLFSN